MEPTNENLHFLSTEDIEAINKKLINLDNERELVLGEGVERDERGFYMTPNGSFWDDEGNYFNRQGLDKNGGSYDKWGVYHAGPEYDEKKGVYNDQKFFILEEEENENQTKPGSKLSQLKDQEEKEIFIKKKYKDLENEEDPEDAYEEGGNNDISYDENEVKETLRDIMEIERNNNIECEDDKMRGEP